MKKHIEDDLRGSKEYSEVEIWIILFQITILKLRVSLLVSN